MSKESSSSTSPNQRTYQIAIKLCNRLGSIEKPINGIISTLNTSYPAFKNLFSLQTDLQNFMESFYNKRITKPYNPITKDRVQTVLSDVYNTFDLLPEKLRFSSPIFEGKIIITKTLEEIGRERIRLTHQAQNTFQNRASQSSSSTHVSGVQSQSQVNQQTPRAVAHHSHRFLPSVMNSERSNSSIPSVIPPTRTTVTPGIYNPFAAQSIFNNGFSSAIHQQKSNEQSSHTK